MTNQTITRLLGAALLLFVGAIVVVVITLPFGVEIKAKSMNAEIINTLVTPVSAIIAALLRGMVGEGK